MTAARPVAGIALAVGAVHHRPTGAAFDVVLLLHVACVVVGTGSVVVGGLQARRLQRAGAGPVPADLRGYFAPGPNWAGRVLYGVPIFGFVLLGMSDGFFELADGWVLYGFVLWILAVAVAEGVLWPTERRIRTAVAAAGPDHELASAVGGECLAGGVAVGRPRRRPRPGDRAHGRPALTVDRVGQQLPGFVQPAVPDELGEWAIEHGRPVDRRGRPAGRL